MSSRQLSLLPRRRPVPIDVLMCAGEREGERERERVSDWKRERERERERGHCDLVV